MSTDPESPMTDEGDYTNAPVFRCEKCGASGLSLAQFAAHECKTEGTEKTPPDSTAAA